MSASISGTEGYAEDAAVLRHRYEEVAFADVHASVLHLMPKFPCTVLDIGAGTGRDAAAFAELGNAVTAVEPVDEMRSTANALHPSPMITWVKDSLPDLAVVSAGKLQYDLVMLTAVWMHLNTDEREKAMPVVVALVRDGGKMMMSLRHGPANPNRRVFDVPADETIALAERCGLSSVLQQSAPSVGVLNRAAGMTWTLLVFVKNGVHAASGF